MSNYTLTQVLGNTTCVASVSYCNAYDPSTHLCTTCVAGYFLGSNNTCVQASTFCVSTDSLTGACTSCTIGYNLVSGTCVQSTVCKSNQYVDTNNNCVTGNFPYCQTYASPSGVCQTCQAGYAFNIKFDCVPSSLTCAGTATSKGYLNNGVCVQTDLNCLQPNSDGSCPICDSGYYSHNGTCYLIPPSTNNSSAQNVP
jgi:hypothetical protein